MYKKIVENFSGASLWSLVLCLALVGFGCGEEDNQRVEEIKPNLSPGVIASECLTGAECAQDTDCGEEERCNLALIVPECQKVKCGGESSYCESDDVCAEGFFCNGDFNPGQCQPLSDELGWCSLHVHCAEGLICGALGRCCEPDTCTPIEGGGEIAPENQGGNGRGSGGNSTVEPGAEGSARVYMQNPEEDEELTDVLIEGVLDPETGLNSIQAKVFNCLNQEGGEAFQFGQLCLQQQTVIPGEDGTYLHITPSSDTDPDDPFAELMMYYHMGRAYDYFTGNLGMLPKETPLLAVVNLQIQFGFGGWFPFDNAAFVPEQAMAQFGLGGIQEDAIVFGQGTNVDFAYDADVILHEYTHAMVGSTRLTGTAIDAYGLDNAPGSLNEAHADYFAASIAEDSVIGAYALTGQGMDLARDLSRFRSCPDDLTGEVHADGEIYGSAIWAVREALGPELADRIVFDSLQALTQLTNFQQAAESAILRAEEEGEEVKAKVVKAFADRGLLDCLRVLKYEDFVSNGADALPLFVEGTQSTGQFAFYDFATAFLQYEVEVPANTRGVKLTATVAEGGFGGFGGGGDVSIAAAWRKGELVTYNYDDGLAETEADGVVAFEKTGQVYTATLSGSCFAEGTHYFHMHNLGQSQVQIQAISMEFMSEDPGLDNVLCDE